MKIYLSPAFRIAAIRAALIALVAACVLTTVMPSPAYATELAAPLAVPAGTCNGWISPIPGVPNVTTLVAEGQYCIVCGGELSSVYPISLPEYNHHFIVRYGPGVHSWYCNVWLPVDGNASPADGATGIPDIYVGPFNPAGNASPADGATGVPIIYAGPSGAANGAPQISAPAGPADATPSLSYATDYNSSRSNKSESCCSNNN